ncbi:hypothetical protein CN154_15130 [Sinorhizobium meliloti]|uniref:hypothetical protein n=1 Tax=Rhizobium meliloti TaxID=382 RepID=UPI000FD70026|nr:hypothetical protein [Sinorhizobium meliloti]RVK75434.1 hypothetical protein CN154_15130 [Sinorhizobium meliloti]
MSDENEQNQGLREAHPPRDFSGEMSIEADPERAAKVGSTRATAEAAMSSLAAELVTAEAEPEQPSLMLDEIDEQQSLFAGPVQHVAETISAARAGRGRPRGSQNRASRQFAETLMRMGYRHPGLNLAALANADPMQLAAELSSPYRPKRGPHAGELVEASCSPADAMALILKANAELMPYFESKRPQQIEVNETRLGVMVIGEVKAEKPDDGRFLSLTKVDRPD